MENEREAFTEHLRYEKEYREDTVKHYLYYYDKFKKEFAINQKAIHDFLIKRFRNNVSRSFVKCYLKFVNKYYEKDYDITKLMPEAKINRERKLPDYVTEHEVKKLEQGLSNERDKLMLLLSFYGALRVNELVNLSPQDFAWDEWAQTQVFDENGKPEKDSDGKNVFGTGRLTIKEEGAKRGKERITRIPPKIMKRVYAYVRDRILPNKHQYLFPGIGGNHLNKRTWQKILHKTGQKVLGRNIKPHALRHGFGYEFMRNNKHIRVLQEILGHSNISTTSIYSRVSGEDLDREVDKFFNKN